MVKDILLVESNDLLRTGLKSIMASDARIEHIYEATDSQYATFLRNHSVDLIIINQALVDDMRMLKNKNFVIITDDPNMVILKGAFDYGAIGYLTVNVSASLVGMILDMEEDSFLIEPILTPMLVKCMSEARSYSLVKDELLTPREREIVRLLHAGLDRASIARDLHIARTTLKTHIKNIARKRETTGFPVKAESAHAS